MKLTFTAKTILAFVLFFYASTAAASVFVYNKPKVDHPGTNIDPLKAYEMIQQDPDKMLIVDVRTPAEYQYVGHPEGAVLVPVSFLGNKFDGKGYGLLDNKNFAKDIMKRFDPAAHTLFFLCRSGTRAAVALNKAVKAGWPAKKAYVILGGFEGEKLKNRNSVFNGQRAGGGWRNEGLPWTYTMKQELMY